MLKKKNLIWSCSHQWELDSTKYTTNRGLVGLTGFTCIDEILPQVVLSSHPRDITIFNEGFSLRIEYKPISPKGVSVITDNAPTSQDLYGILYHEVLMIMTIYHEVLKRLFHKKEKSLGRYTLQKFLSSWGI